MGEIQPLHFSGKLLTSKAKHHFGDLVRFQCNFGFVMSGSASLLCLSTGQWNATVPECMCKSLFIFEQNDPLVTSILQNV